MTRHILFTIQTLSILVGPGCYPEHTEPPVANAGADQTITLPTNSVTLNGNASSDPDGHITSYRWNKMSGPPSSTIVNGSTAQTEVKDLTEGIYEFELTVTDNEGNNSKDRIMITVIAAPVANHAPTANAGANLGINVPANSVTIDGSNSIDPDNDPIVFSWTKISGPVSFTIQNANTARTQIDNLEGGIYEFELTVSDNGGLSDKDTVRILVNRPPLSNAGADQLVNITAYQTFLNGTASSDPDGGLLTYSWAKVGGTTPINIPSPSSALALVYFYVGGVSKFELTVTDSMGLFSKDTVSLHVNSLPVANAGPDQTIQLPINSITLNGAASTDPDNNIVSYTWTMVNGPLSFYISNPTSAQTQVSNLTEGDYIFELTVKDAGNLMSKGQVHIAVDTIIPNNIITINGLVWQPNCTLTVPNFYSTIPQGQPFKAYLRPVYPGGWIGGWELVRHASLASPNEPYNYEIFNGALLINAPGIDCMWDDALSYTVGIVLL